VGNGSMLVNNKPVRKSLKLHSLRKMLEGDTHRLLEASNSSQGSMIGHQAARVKTTFINSDVTYSLGYTSCKPKAI